jgi:hypothetical protein
MDSWFDNTLAEAHAALAYAAFFDWDSGDDLPFDAPAYCTCKSNLDRERSFLREMRYGTSRSIGIREDIGQTLPVPRCDCLPTAKVSKKRRAVMVTDGSLGKCWESVSANNKENR